MIDIGSLVALKSGGPWMTVGRVNQDADGQTVVVCDWTDASGQEHRVTYLEHELVERPADATP